MTALFICLPPSFINCSGNAASCGIFVLIRALPSCGFWIVFSHAHRLPWFGFSSSAHIQQGKASCLLDKGVGFLKLISKAAGLLGYLQTRQCSLLSSNPIGGCGVHTAGLAWTGATPFGGNLGHVPLHLRRPRVCT